MTPLTRARTFIAAAAAVLALGFAAAPAASAAPAGGDPNGCSATYFQGHSYLGPVTVAHSGADGAELRGYDRFGGEDEQTFLNTYYNAATGFYTFPPDNGYVIGPDGQPEISQTTLQPGTDIDRYGSVFGSFLAPAGSSYASRSIPPSSLDNSSNPAPCNYHDYQVLKAFAVDTGPVAPWFNQAGEGTQYQLDPTLIPGAPATVNVMWLLNNGYLMQIG